MTRAKPRKPTHTPGRPAEPTKAGRLPRDILTLLGLLAVCLVYFQYTTLDKFGILPPGRGYASLRIFWLMAAQAVPLDGWDALNVGILAAAAVGILVVERRSGSLTRLLDSVFRSESRTMLALGIASLVLVRFYFASGDLSWVADASAHIGYAWVAAQSFAIGEIPIWTNYYGTGSPFLQFYGFTFYYAVALVDLATRDLFLSIKLVLAGCHVLSGLAMYRFVRALCHSRRAGFIAGLAYVLCFWHTQQVLSMGRLPVSAFYACLPMPFYFLERLRVARNRPAATVWGALFLGLLAFTHPGYAFWATLLFVVYATVRIGVAKRCPNRVAWARWAALLGAAGLVFGSFLTVPMWVERPHTGLQSGLSLSALPDPTWEHLLVWSSHRLRLWPLPEGQDHWYGGYLGLSLIGIAASGLWVAGRRRGTRGLGRWAPLTTCLGISLLLVFGYRWPGLQDLSVVQALNAGRYLLFVTAFLSAAAGVGAIHLARRKGGAFAILLFVILADLGPTTFQHPFLRNGQSEAIVPLPADKLSQLRRDRDRQPAGRLPDSRIYYATGQAYRPRVAAWIPVMAGARSPLATHNEAPLAVQSFVEPFERLINPVLETEGRGLDNPQDYLAGLHLLNITRTYALVADTSQPTGWLLSGWTFPEFGPVLVSPRATGWAALPSASGVQDPEARVLSLIQTMGVNSDAGTCRQVVVADTPFHQDLGGSPSAQVLSHRVWNQRVQLRLRVTGPCFARLSYSHYPYLRVTVDGQEVEAMVTAGRFIAVRLDAGEHTIRLEPLLSPLRRLLLGLDIVLLAAGAVVLIHQRRNRRNT